MYKTGFDQKLCELKNEECDVALDNKFLSFLVQGGPATAFDLATFWLSMIAPVKKSVNHSRMQRACAERAENNNNIKKFVFAAIRQREVNSLLILLVIAFFAVTDFFGGNVRLTFSFLLVLRLSLHAVYYAKNETSEESLYMYMFLDARSFCSLQVLKLCFCLEDPQDQEKGQPSNAYVEEFIFSSERPKINPS